MCFLDLCCCMKQRRLTTVQGLANAGNGCVELQRVMDCCDGQPFMMAHCPQGSALAAVVVSVREWQKFPFSIFLSVSAVG